MRLEVSSSRARRPVRALGDSARVQERQDKAAITTSRLAYDNQGSWNKLVNSLGPFGLLMQRNIARER